MTRSTLASLLLAAALPHGLQSLRPRTPDRPPKREAAEAARVDSDGVGVRIASLEFQRGPYVTIELERPADVSLWVMVKRQRPALAWPQPRGSFGHAPDHIHLVPHKPGSDVLRGWLWPYPGVDSAVSRLGELLTGADVTWTADACTLDPTRDFRTQGPQACASGGADGEP